MKNIFQFEVDGKAALGFDTGLSAQAFAQAKMASFVTDPGLIVFSDERTETWQAAGVIEYAQTGAPGTMVVWGPVFDGERLDNLIAGDSRKDQALNAVRRWTAALCVLQNTAHNSLSITKGNTQGDYSLRPYGAIIAPENSAEGRAVFFPPRRLVERCVQAEGNKAWINGGEAYVHPDLNGNTALANAAAFTASAMLYRIFSGKPPFPNQDENLLHQDIREGVFLPVHLASPGLDEKIAGLINSALSPKNGKFAGGKKIDRPTLKNFIEVIGLANFNSFFHTLPPLEKEKIEKEREHYLTKNKRTVTTRRFIIRNTVVIAGVFIALLIGIFTVRGIIQRKADLPSTAGMDSAEVIQMYYDSISALDHQRMEACVMGKAGKNDINMVSNYYVLTKVRQAYEPNLPGVMPAQEWLAAGKPGGVSVFGISDLAIEKVSGNETGDETAYRTTFILWLPENQSDDAENAVPDWEFAPTAYPCIDELRLVRHKGNWKIGVIERREGCSNSK
ncbi:MAG: hypothetical protein LBN21_02495 [Treponema sp.]|nr:hypothetical protein [Treponema sp.]